MPLKKESMAAAHPAFLDELLPVTLNKPTLTFSMCLKFEASCKVAGSFPVIVIWSLASLLVSGNGHAPALPWQKHVPPPSASTGLDWQCQCDQCQWRITHKRQFYWQMKQKQTQSTSAELFQLGYPGRITIFSNVSKYRFKKWGTEKCRFSKYTSWKTVLLNKSFTSVLQFAFLCFDKLYSHVCWSVWVSQNLILRSLFNSSPQELNCIIHLLQTAPLHLCFKNVEQLF